MIHFMQRIREVDPLCSTLYKSSRKVNEEPNVNGQCSSLPLDPNPDEIEVEVAVAGHDEEPAHGEAANSQLPV